MVLVLALPWVLKLVLLRGSGLRWHDSSLGAGIWQSRRCVAQLVKQLGDLILRARRRLGLHVKTQCTVVVSSEQ
jgi:hypothetical protein